MAEQENSWNKLWSLIRSPTLREMVKRLRVLWALGHASALMGWDLETYMPKKGIRDRSVASEEISALMHSIATAPWLRELLSKAEKELNAYNEYEKGLYRVVSRMVRIETSLPEELVRREARITSKATKVWEEAKKQEDFARFKPYLEEIVEIQREKAERLGYEEHPYDALLDLYEEGLRSRDVDQVFDKLVPETKRVLAAIERRGYYPRWHPLEGVGYEEAKARETVRRILDYLDYPWDRARVDVSAHPFTIDMGVNDVRITVRYEGVDFKRFVYSTMHEYGHALYELQQDPRLSYTPLIGGVSLGVHESQSRFWENIVGRSPWYMLVLKKIVDDTLGVTRGLSAEELYRYVNTVRPSPIRVDADEVTYNLHIYLRYKLEKQLIEGSLRVDELPEAWDSLMEQLLGIRPRSPSEGVLQDIHWAHGSIGYFPTYTLGNTVAAMIWRSLGGPDSQQLRGPDVEALKKWLGERIHRWGRVHPPKELLCRSLGGEYSADALVEYLEWKYLRLPSQLPDVFKA